MRMALSWRYVANAGGGRVEYLGGMKAMRLARRCILDSSDVNSGLWTMSRGTRLKDASGRRVENGPTAGRSLFGRRGTVTMVHSISRRDSASIAWCAKGAVRRVARRVRIGEGLAGTG